MARWRATRRALMAAASAVGWFVCGPPLLTATPAGASEPVPAAMTPSTSSQVRAVPPVAPLRILRRFDPPAQPWLAGHRGVDLAASAGEPVAAAGYGHVVFSGRIAGRGVVSISVGSIRFTYEPIEPAVAVGEIVRPGTPLGTVARQPDHCGPPGSCLHWGAIRDGRYVDPLLFLRHVRLLPLAATPPAAPNALDPVPDTLGFTSDPLGRASDPLGRPLSGFPVLSEGPTPLSRARPATSRSPTEPDVAPRATRAGGTPLSPDTFAPTLFVAAGLAVTVAAISKRRFRPHHRG